MQSFRLKGFEVLAAMEGGMSVVYKARRESSGEFMAIKVLKPEFSQDTQTVQRFHNEFVVTRGLQHRNIVRVLPLDCIRTRHQQDRHFFVMEFIEGLDLQEVIEKRGPMTRGEIIDVVSQTCDSLHYAHTLAHHPVIHRDLKSSNVIIENNTGRVVLTDFGIAQSVDAPGPELSLIGTAEYMSPEHALGKRTDERSDLYSLGVIMYEMATGTLPFRAAPGPNAAREILQKHITQVPVPPKQVNASVSPSLDAMIMLLLDKEPMRRYQSAAVLQSHLTQQWTTQTGFVPYGIIQKEARRRMRLPMAMLALMTPVLLGLGAAGYLTVSTLWSWYQARGLDDQAALSYREKDWDGAVVKFRDALARAYTKQRELFLRRAEGQQGLVAGAKKFAAGQVELAIEDLHLSVDRLGSAKSRQALVAAQAELKYLSCVRTGDRAFVEAHIDEAIAAYREAVEAKPTPEVQQRLNRALATKWAAEGKQKAEAGEWEAALAAYHKAQEAHPEGRYRDGALRAIGMVAYEAKTLAASKFVEQGRYDEAIDMLKGLLRVRHDARARELLGKATHDRLVAQAQQAQEEGEWAKAIENYKRALRERSSAATEQMLAKAHHAHLAVQGDGKASANDWAAASDLYARALSFGRDEGTRERLDRARAEVEYARYLSQARIASRDGKIDAAIAAANAAIEAKPTEEAKAEARRLQLQKWTGLAEASWEREDWVGAAEAYERLEELDPRPELKRKAMEARAEHQYRTSYERGRAAADGKDWAAALKAFMAACEAKKTPQAQAGLRAAGYHQYMAKGEAHASKNEWAAAVVALKKAREFMPTEEADLALADAESNLAYQSAYDRGVEASGKEDWAVAVAAFQEALKYKNRYEATEKLKQSKYFLVMGLARAEEEAGEWAQASEYYEQAKVVWDRPDVRARIADVSYCKWFADARVRRGANEVNQAREAFGRAVKVLSERQPTDEPEPDQIKNAPPGAVEFRKEFLAGQRAERSTDWAQAIQHYRSAEKHAIDDELIRKKIGECLSRFVQE